MHTSNKFSVVIAGLFLASAVLFSCNESKNESHAPETENKTAQPDTVKTVAADKKTDKPKADQPKSDKGSKSDKKVTDNSKKGS